MLRCEMRAALVQSRRESSSAGARQSSQNSGRQMWLGARTLSRPSRSAFDLHGLPTDDTLPLVSFPPDVMMLSSCSGQASKHDGAAWVDLQAQHLYLRDVHYLVRGNAAVIIDESTGRANLQSRWMEGIHQARGDRLCHLVCRRPCHL